MKNLPARSEERRAEAHNQQRQNNSPLAPVKPHVCRALAPPLHQHYSRDTVTAIIELAALHLRRTIPALRDLTLNDFDVALADLRPQIDELIESEIRVAIDVMREMSWNRE